MTGHHGNDAVSAGIYVNPRRLSFVSLDEDGDLPGPPRDLYLRVPALALLLLAPLVGGLFVVLLPLVGVALLAWAAGGKILDLLGRTLPLSTRQRKP
jgi:hypothetical protein